ncbi:MAG: response regulator [Rhodobacteraceae bacterium]|nr:response regulator [Paracoccaceae bacterium]
MSKTVLIIEDEPNIIESLTFLLGREGLRVFAEKDGGAAMQRINETTPDLVILDAMLPNRSGFDILRDIQASDKSMPKVLMLTAKGQPRDRQMATEIGVDLFMTKPFSNSEIISEIRRLLGI